MNTHTPTLPLTQAEEVTLARLAETLAAAIASKAGSGESVYTATCRGLSECPEIVRAVNSHKDLLAALREVENFTRMMPGNPHWEYIAQDLQKTARAAIAKAEGRTP